MKLIIFLVLFISNIVAYANPIMIGILKFAPPFSSEGTNKNQYTGFCVDLMQEICKRMGQPCQYQGTMPSKQMQELRQGRFDVTFSPSPITPIADSDLVFSQPLIPSMGQFVILKNANIHSVKDLDHEKIGVIKAMALKPNILSHYAPNSSLHEYPTGMELLNALNTHQVNAILVNSSIAKYLIKHDLYNLQQLGEPIDIGMGYGMVALKQNTVLIQKINDILTEMEADGTYLTIYNRYFGK